jgi:integrase/recombinase XerD
MAIIHQSQLNGITHYLKAKGFSQSTRQNIIREYIQFRTWLANQSLNVEELQYNDVMAYIQHLQTKNLTARTIQSYIGSIKNIFNYWVDTKVVEHNPIQQFNLKGVKRKTTYNVLSPEELETLYKEFNTEVSTDKQYSPRMIQEQKLCLLRDKVILGLMIYQGLKSEELSALELSHLDLQQGTILISEARRRNERLLKLESHQVISFYEYINTIRKELLICKYKKAKSINKQLPEAITNLFISHDVDLEIKNLLFKLSKNLQKQNPKLSGLKHIRASVIVNWLNQYNKRKVQHMIGHRYISSTESYEASNIMDLQEDFNNFFPILD